MKVQIESELIETRPETINQFNYILKRAIQIQSLSELKLWEQSQNNNMFRFGFGSDHCWVKQYASNGTLSENRLLLITK